MGIAVSKTTFEVFRSVETASFNAADFILIEKGRDNTDFTELDGVVPTKYWKVVNNRLTEMSALEKVAVDADWLSHTKYLKRKEAERAANSLVQSRYTMEQQQTISYLMDEAERLNLNQRYTYFNQVGIWAKTIITQFYVYEAMINACTLIEQVTAIRIDFSPFLATDPDVRIGVGSQILL